MGFTTEKNEGDDGVKTFSGPDEVVPPEKGKKESDDKGDEEFTMEKNENGDGGKTFSGLDEAKSHASEAPTQEDWKAPDLPFAAIEEAEKSPVHRGEEEDGLDKAGNPTGIDQSGNNIMNINKMQMPNSMLQNTKVYPIERWNENLGYDWKGTYQWTNASHICSYEDNTCWCIGKVRYGHPNSSKWTDWEDVEGSVQCSNAH